MCVYVCMWLRRETLEVSVDYSLPYFPQSFTESRACQFGATLVAGIRRLRDHDKLCPWLLGNWIQVLCLCNHLITP